jgi:hypothetical protein
MRRIQIHPSHGGGGGTGGRARRQAADQPVVYTVWKRSSIGFQGTDGFSVYDSAGKLAFRVDNYSRRRKAFAGDLMLMDGHGTPLLSLRPQVDHLLIHFITSSLALLVYVYYIALAATCLLIDQFSLLVWNHVYILR